MVVEHTGGYERKVLNTLFHGHGYCGYLPVQHSKFPELTRKLIAHMSALESFALDLRETHFVSSRYKRTECDECMQCIQRTLNALPHLIHYDIDVRPHSVLKSAL